MLDKLCSCNFPDVLTVCCLLLYNEERDVLCHDDQHSSMVYRDHSQCIHNTSSAFLQCLASYKHHMSLL